MKPQILLIIFIFFIIHLSLQTKNKANNNQNNNNISSYESCMKLKANAPFINLNCEKYIRKNIKGIEHTILLNDDIAKIKKVNEKTQKKLKNLLVNLKNKKHK